MKNLNFKIFTLLFVFSFSFFSCKKENVLNDLTNSESSLLKFDDVEEFQNEMTKIIAFSPEARVAYEKANNFESFGRKCDEIYATIDPESFTSIEEVKAFVAKNSDYLQLIEEEEGDFTLETKMFNKSIKYLINNDYMLQIGDTVLKIFESGMAIAHISKKNELQKMSVAEFENEIVNPNYSSIKKNRAKGELFAKDYTSRIESGSDRLYLGVECSDWTLLGLLDHKIEYMLRPYRKTLGVWFQCSRTIEGNIDVEFAYLDLNGRYQVGARRESISRANRSHASNIWKIDSRDGTKFQGFHSLNCWGTSAAISGKRCEIIR